MKKFIVIVCAILFVPIMADDYADSIGEITTSIRQNLNFASTSTVVTSANVQRYIRESFIILSGVVSGKYLADTVIVSASDIDYAVDTQIIKINKVICKYGDTLLALKYHPLDDWRSLAITPYLSQTGIMSHSSFYDWEYGWVFLYPPPVKIDTIIVYGYTKVLDIMSDSTFPQDYGVIYRPAAIAYATSQLAASMKMWSEADWWSKEFDKQANILKMNLQKVSGE